MISIQRSLFAPEDKVPDRKPETKLPVKAEMLLPAKKNIDSTRDQSIVKMQETLNENLCLRIISNMSNPESERLEALRELKHAEWSVMQVIRGLENISDGLLESKTTQPVSRDAQLWVEQHWHSTSV